MDAKLFNTSTIHRHWNWGLIFCALLALAPLNHAWAWLGEGGGTDTNDLADPSACPGTCSCPPGQTGQQCTTCQDSATANALTESSIQPSFVPLLSENGTGMPYYWVSQKFINLRLEDEPLGYKPARGLPVKFHLSYRQRGAVNEDPTIFSAGTNWSFSFRAFVYAPSSGEPGLHRGGAGMIFYDVADGLPYPEDGTIMTTLASGGFQLTHPDGQTELFTYEFTDSAGNVDYFLTSSSDPAGNTITYTYAVNGGVLQLLGVTDPEGGANTTQLYYENSAYPNRVTSVADPFSRTCYLKYDNAGYLTNIVDVAGLSSSFGYDANAFRSWVTNLTTPYGTTGFTFGGTDATNGAMVSAGVNRCLTVQLPTGGHELYLYQHQCSFLGDWSPTVPNTTPFANNFSSPNPNYFDSFYWGPLQYEGLSTSNPNQLTETDYACGRLRHWLDGGAEPLALEFERAPSPEGVTIGQCTWYDYQGATSSGSGYSDLPSIIAKVLPDGSTEFKYLARNQYLTVTNEVETYSLEDGEIGLRTNLLYYAANGIDLVQWVGPNGEQVVSNYFAPGNTSHQPDASFDALEQGTYYKYNSHWQPKLIARPTGLVISNNYYASGSALDRLQSTVAPAIQYTNSFTYYNNGLVQTFTDPRGLTSTLFWDNLQRLTGIGYPDNTTVSNLYTFLDCTATKDRDGYWRGRGYNALRQVEAQTNANNVVTRYGHCDCGLLFAVTNAWNTPA